MKKIGFLVLCCFFLLFTVNIAFGKKASTIEQQEKIAETSRYYLESNGGYHSGDLITESQIEELQLYLRRSFGNSAASHRGLLNRSVKDSAPLSRYFYREQGSQVLKSASEKLGGYAAIEVLSLNREGRQIIQNAIATDSDTEIISTVAESRQNQVDDSIREQKKNSSYNLKAIYTLEDFLEAAFPKNSE